MSYVYVSHSEEAFHSKIAWDKMTAINDEFLLIHGVTDTDRKTWISTSKLHHRHHQNDDPVPR